MSRAGRFSQPKRQTGLGGIVLSAAMKSSKTGSCTAGNSKVPILVENYARQLEAYKTREAAENLFINAIRPIVILCVLALEVCRDATGSSP